MSQLLIRFFWLDDSVDWIPAAASYEYEYEARPPIAGEIGPGKRGERDGVGFAQL